MRLPASYLCSFPGLGEKPANRSGSRVVLFDFFLLSQTRERVAGCLAEAQFLSLGPIFFLLFFTDIFSYVLYHDGSDTGTFDSSANL